MKIPLLETRDGTEEKRNFSHNDIKKTGMNGIET